MEKTYPIDITVGYVAKEYVGLFGEKIIKAHLGEAQEYLNSLELDTNVIIMPLTHWLDVMQGWSEAVQSSNYYRAEYYKQKSGETTDDSTS